MWTIGLQDRELTCWEEVRSMGPVRRGALGAEWAGLGWGPLRSPCQSPSLALRCPPTACLILDQFQQLWPGD